MKTTSIMIVGVGGQGTLLASRILGNAVIDEGFDVKVSEVHGMSQRGGSVVTYVKFGDKVYSPVIDKGEADIILAFEQLEAYRALPWLKKGGRIIVNEQKINPMPVITGAANYPENIIEKLKEMCSVTSLDALELAKEAGSIKTVNVVLIGVLAKSTDIPYESWVKTLLKTVPEKFAEMNLKAFELGYNFDR
ncbi:MAG: indolepyruvate oxidoreductase subunit beta [Oscillospiraceae bacterium]|nr:indolepyruvate oxidoreductase subunit beta [Oscillospiraceae bacterium]MDD7470248.1 indolepyruvate oxidoreductase subunit beta [Oscillospiraceae bacterium]MDY2677565.1 indolepyruvate oxidoreductase subunit beta [Oscillospiraceae bacterium]